jgi:hypothetical protein
MDTVQKRPGEKRERRRTTTMRRRRIRLDLNGNKFSL